jgi:predicted small lipoprotein YifL
MHCWARYLFLAVVAVLGTGQMLAACGQKGDLYLVKDGSAAAKKDAKGQWREKPVSPPDYAAQADGESLEVLDAVPSETPDPGSI